MRLQSNDNFLVKSSAAKTYSITKAADIQATTGGPGRRDKARVDVAFGRRKLQGNRLTIYLRGYVGATLELNSDWSYRWDRNAPLDASATPIVLDLWHS